MAGGARRSNNAYKMGKLSKSGRFSNKKLNPTPFIVIGCVFLTFVFAIILGNYLGNLAEESKNTTTAEGNSSVNLPDINKNSPLQELNAYFADMSNASAGESLSLQTSSARERGNALYLELRDDNGDLIYASDKSRELEFPSNENLELNRLGNHFQYYQDYALAHFKSEFSASLASEKRIVVQTNEILILDEAASSVFSQIIVEFEADITKDDLIYYQTYLLNLKLACEETPVGVTLPYAFLADSDNAGSIASIMDIADYFVLDLGKMTVQDMEDALRPLSYVLERYENVIIIDDGEEDLDGRIGFLAEKGLKNYIVR